MGTARAGAGKVHPWFLDHCPGTGGKWRNTVLSVPGFRCAGCGLLGWHHDCDWSVVGRRVELLRPSFLRNRHLDFAGTPPCPRKKTSTALRRSRGSPGSAPVLVLLARRGGTVLERPHSALELQHQQPVCPGTWSTASPAGRDPPRHAGAPAPSTSRGRPERSC